MTTDDGLKYLRVRHLQQQGVVDSRMMLERLKDFGFPPGKLLTPRMRVWTQREIDAWLDSRPTTQAELADITKPKATRKKVPA